MKSFAHHKYFVSFSTGSLVNINIITFKFSCSHRTAASTVSGGAGEGPSVV